MAVATLETAFFGIAKWRRFAAHDVFVSTLISVALSKYATLAFCFALSASNDGGFTNVCRRVAYGLSQNHAIIAISTFDAAFVSIAKGRPFAAHCRIKAALPFVALFKHIAVALFLVHGTFMTGVCAGIANGLKHIAVFAVSAFDAAFDIVAIRLGKVTGLAIKTVKFGVAGFKDFALADRFAFGAYVFDGSTVCLGFVTFLGAFGLVFPRFIYTA